MAERGRTLKKMSSKRNFLDTINLLYILGKLFGLSCYSLSKGRIKCKVSFEICDFLQLVAFLAAYSTLIYYNYQNELNITNDAKNTIIFNSAQQILILVSLAFLVAGIIKTVLARHKFWEIANTLSDIDQQVYASKKNYIKFNKCILR